MCCDCLEKGIFIGFFSTMVFLVVCSGVYLLWEQKFGKTKEKYCVALQDILPGTNISNGGGVYYTFERVHIYGDSVPRHLAEGTPVLKQDFVIAKDFIQKGEHLGYYMFDYKEPTSEKQLVERVLDNEKEMNE